MKGGGCCCIRNVWVCGHVDFPWCQFGLQLIFQRFAVRKGISFCFDFINDLLLLLHKLLFTANSEFNVIFMVLLHLLNFFNLPAARLF